MSEEKKAPFSLYTIIMFGFLFGIGFELATWAIDGLMSILGFPLG